MPAIAREREGQFLILFVLLFLASLGLVVWYEVRHETGDDGWDTAIAIGMGMSYCVRCHIDGAGIRYGGRSGHVSGTIQ